MLSKVAERIYWSARYLERVESTARLLSIYDKLMFDLPRRVNLGWYNLIVINSLEEDFNNRYSVRDERNVVKFLLGDDNNPCSVVNSLRAIRENIRTTRDVIPGEAWEMVNELSLFVQESLAHGVNRSVRHEFLESIVKTCQQIVGLLSVNMTRDEAWEMLQLGQNVERADMTTRNLDAGIAAIQQVQDDDYAVNARQIIWGNVLRSLNADQPYRRAMRSSIKGDTVVDFLMGNEQFPRSLTFCANEIAERSKRLPKSEQVVERALAIRSEVSRLLEADEFGASFRDDLNDLQVSLAEVHGLIQTTWFLSDK
ncbi:alpha-E domain-containing protein [Parathalassolituus penaei]|uniref:Alpha-E domain-containing protein n=1 Tax=Parathalassolituus penaei TaxID=2997323 RepID=A0A9X3EG15_9GAMM|nr:alpha-E domain-containing protein [Parathalassolituus penaei]MCY0966867.1 alpha-E domain-containing protein [Parathalassolituus penaei]